MQNYLRVVGENIRAIRIAKNIPFVKLAKDAGVSKGNLSKIENHPCNVSLGTLWKLAKVLGVNVKELLP